jgi:hypothetical protein
MYDQLNTEGFNLTDEEIKALNAVLEDQISQIDEEEINRDDIIKDLNESILGDYGDLSDEGRALFLFLVDQKQYFVPIDIDERGYDYFGAPYFEIGGSDYVVIPDSMIESVFHDYAEELIDECILPELNEKYRSYFDYDKFIQDMSFDGYGQMSSYDGEDNEQKYNDEYYHILRM